MCLHWPADYTSDKTENIFIMNGNEHLIIFANIMKKHNGTGLALAFWPVPRFPKRILHFRHKMRVLSENRLAI